MKISAAMGLTSFESINEFGAVNYCNYWVHRQDLKSIPEMSLIEFDESEKNNYHYIVIEIDDKSAGLSREQLVKIRLPTGTEIGETEIEQICQIIRFALAHASEIRERLVHLP